jgi:hypothetical protein
VANASAKLASRPMKRLLFFIDHSRNAYQKSDGLDSGSESAKRKRLFRYVFMREKSIAGLA